MKLFIAFIVGMVVMDVMWAWKLKIPQMMYYRWKHRNDPQPNFEQE
jgi:hypothetical protein